MDTSDGDDGVTVDGDEVVGNDRTAKRPKGWCGVALGTAVVKGARAGGVVVRHALRPLRSRGDRSPRMGWCSRGVPVGGSRRGERCDPLARGRGGPEFGGAAAGARLLLLVVAGPGSDRRDVRRGIDAP